MCIRDSVISHEFTEFPEPNACGTENKPYIRLYTEGSLIQEQALYFFPWEEDSSEGWGQYRGVNNYPISDCGTRARRDKEYGVEEDNRVRYLMDQIISCGRNDVSKPYESFKLPDDYINTMEHKEIYYKYNMDNIVSKEYLAENALSGIKLSDILKRISVARERDSSISGDWFCIFCREGEMLNIDTLKECDTFQPELGGIEEDYLPRLPEDFFESDITFEGASDELRNQSSLASNSQTAYFMDTVNELVAYSQTKVFSEISGGLEKLKTIVDKLKTIVDKLKKSESLDPDEVCFIFQMINFINRDEGGPEPHPLASRSQEQVQQEPELEPEQETPLRILTMEEATAEGASKDDGRYATGVSIEVEEEGDKLVADAAPA